jgi:hypothetical protein
MQIKRGRVFPNPKYMVASDRKPNATFLCGPGGQIPASAEATRSACAWWVQQWLCRNQISVYPEDTFIDLVRRAEDFLEWEGKVEG